MWFASHFNYIVRYLPCRPFSNFQPVALQSYNNFRIEEMGWAKYINLLEPPIGSLERQKSQNKACLNYSAFQGYSMWVKYYLSKTLIFISTMFLLKGLLSVQLDYCYIFWVLWDNMHLLHSSRKEDAI